MTSTDTYTNDSGFLDAGYHKIYWEDWGKKDAKPVFYLHGGPGGGCSESVKELFDPKIHRVIFHDQRGSGRSTPFADITENTTQDLIEDIEKLREHLGFEKVYVSGGSWGSALTLFYAIAYPERVERFVIWSTYLGRQFEDDFVYEGYARHFLPNEWRRFIDLVPEKHRTDGQSVIEYYTKQILQEEDKEKARKYAHEWTLWEISLCSIEYDPEQFEKEVLEDKSTPAIARLEAHYFVNKCFVPENYVIDNIDKIKHIPATVVHGRFDMCTPPVSAQDLADVYGENLELIWTNSSHLKSDPEMRAALIRTFKNVFV